MNELVKPLLNQGEGIIPVLKTDRPNIILIIVESLTAKAVGVTGKIKGITPNLDSIAKEGILFDKVFASADRTDKGIAAVLAAYPSLPGSSPLKYRRNILF
ncbi:MAG: sulfatase-like hydrolase/transferase [Bacteroidales bacterium]|nr:sulfatase-like hydrolase/transferase [Bacteroidales bacterium]